MGQIPQGLKKKLQANLATLTAKEAGRLFVIYAHEAEAKQIRVFDYPPTKALDAALRQRAVAQDGPEKATKAFRGFTFLAGLWEVVNTEGSNLFLTTAFDALRQSSTVLALLQQDATAMLIRSMRSLIGRPLPVPDEDFARVVAWENGERLWMFSEVAESMVEREEDMRWEVASEKLPTFQVPIESQTSDDLMLMPEEKFRALYAEQQQLRRAWAEGQGDWLLRDAFSGDKKRLEEWIEYEQIFYRYSDVERAARQAAIIVELSAKLEVGQLNGGLVLDHPEALYAPVLIHEYDGVMPAWAALRILWKPYLISRGYRVYAGVTLTGFPPYLADEILASDGQPVRAADLTELTADFLKACQRRPWGKQLPVEFDVDLPADLSGFLMQAKNPFLHLDAPDLGQVDFVDWARYDAKGLDWKMGSAATAASLAAAGFAPLAGEEIANEYFYAHPHAEATQLKIWHTFDLMNDLDTGLQPFTYRSREDVEEGLPPLSALLGIELLTPLESNVRALRSVADQLANIRAAFDRVSEHYFGGLPILSKALDAHLQQAESYRREAEHYVKSWLDRLAVHPWNVDTSTINPGEPEVNEDKVKDIIDSWLKHTRRKTAIKNETNFLE
jgi:hypothetical protein